LVNGDILGARARANGSVEVFKNGALVGIADASAWSGSAGGGVIGMRVTNGTAARLDDFGGGASTCPGSASTPTPQPAPTQTPTPIVMAASKVLAKPAQQGAPPNVCAKFGIVAANCKATTYYHFGSQRVAMHEQTDANAAGAVY
jgi:hypothetical protein